jgi:hypothetical protein
VRIAGWIRVRWRPIENRLRRLLHLPGRPVVVKAEAAGALSLAGHVSAVKSIDEGASLERKIAFLLRRDLETQANVDSLGKRLGDLEAASERRLDELRGAMEAHVARELAAAREDYRAVRIYGTVALALGLLSTTLANFV